MVLLAVCVDGFGEELMRTVSASSYGPLERHARRMVMYKRGQCADGCDSLRELVVDAQCDRAVLVDRAALWLDVARDFAAVGRALEQEIGWVQLGVAETLDVEGLAGSRRRPPAGAPRGAVMAVTEVPQKPERLYAPMQFEARDEMPEDYRRMVLRLLRETNEIGSVPVCHEQMRSMTHNVKLAPDPVSRVRIVEFFADEMRHQKIFDGVVRSMGEVPDDDFVSSIDGLNATDSIGSWLDLALLNTFIDRVGGFQLFDYAESSFAPLARAGVAVAKDEMGHCAMGFQHLREYCSTPRGARGGDREDAALVRLRARHVRHVDRDPAVEVHRVRAEDQVERRAAHRVPGAHRAVLRRVGHAPARARRGAAEVRIGGTT